MQNMTNPFVELKLEDLRVHPVCQKSSSHPCIKNESEIGCNELPTLKQRDIFMHTGYLRQVHQGQCMKLK